MAKKTTKKKTASRKRAARKRSKAVEAAERLVAAARKSIRKPEIEPPVGDVELAQKLGRARDELGREMRKAIVGMEGVIDELLVALLSHGHVLLDGPPGTAKARLVDSLARTLTLSCQRVALVPDLLLSPVTNMAEASSRRESGLQRPIVPFDRSFTDVFLAEDIDNASPRTQAALLEAMRAGESAASDGHEGPPELFFLVATRNPQRQEIGSPLSETQLDRFMCNIEIGFPNEQEEIDIMQRVPGNRRPDLQVVLEERDLRKLQDLVDRVPVSEQLLRYAAALVRATRPSGDNAPGFIRDFVSAGCGPHASLDLITAAKARAILHGRFCVALEDVQALLQPVLRHRLTLTFTAHSEGVDADHVLVRLLEEIASDKPLHGSAPHQEAGS